MILTVIFAILTYLNFVLKWNVEKIVNISTITLKIVLDTLKNPKSFLSWNALLRIEQPQQQLQAQIITHIVTQTHHNNINTELHIHNHLKANSHIAVYCCGFMPSNELKVCKCLQVVIVGIISSHNIQTRVDPRSSGCQQDQPAASATPGNFATCKKVAKYCRPTT